ncbi:universal stress protein [Novosphingobium sp.]|uniref:universal stress protein n=1 Tax=Novosphingobium sp. TaxID=1874826 RepID=UPI0033415AE2
MYQSIVVAYDGTGPSDAALRRGAELARVCGAQLHLLGIVISQGGLLLDPAVVPIELLQTERHYLLEALANSVRDLEQLGQTALTAVRDGDAAREIIGYVHENHCDLVVIGHGGGGILARWFEGSVGTRLLDQLPCSLLVAIDDPAAAVAAVG